MASNGNGAARQPPSATNGNNSTNARAAGNGHGNSPYYAYRYDYADNKYYPERAPGKQPHSAVHENLFSFPQSNSAVYLHTKHVRFTSV